jgi:tetratricopeptide (TPR) repeat protein
VRLKQRVQAVHKEILLLVVLSAATIPMFLFTRAMAVRNRSLHARIAASWYQQGKQRLESGDAKGAIELFRNATTNDHDNAEYSLLLAQALAIENNVPEARITLLKLRESSPENGEINLDLARIAAKTGDSHEAVRYYHNALYGIWPEKDLDQRRRTVRAELIDFLLQKNESNAALAELLIFSREIPDTVSEHVRAGRFFLSASDPARGLDHFRHALRLDRNNGDAMIGAGRSSFQLGRYAQTARYLQGGVAIGMVAEDANHLLDISKYILSNDPLARGLTERARAMRLSAGFQSVETRLSACISEHNSDNAAGIGSTLETLEAEVKSVRPSLTVANIRRDPELIRNGLALIARSEAAANESCGKPKDSDHALLLIARLHGLEENDQSDR